MSSSRWVLKIRGALFSPLYFLCSCSSLVCFHASSILDLVVDCLDRYHQLTRKQLTDPDICTLQKGTRWGAHLGSGLAAAALYWTERITNHHNAGFWTCMRPMHRTLPQHGQALCKIFKTIMSLTDLSEGMCALPLDHQSFASTIM